MDMDNENKCLEIERKFLCGDIPFNLEDYPCLNITQAYISTSPTIRIRKSNDEYILTIKGSGAIAREEYELSLTQKQFERLYAKVETPPVIKKRYLVPLKKKLVAEVDVYEEHLEGLKTIEVEFKSISDAKKFVPPTWFGPDVTLDGRYKNTKLSKFGIPENHLYDNVKITK